MTDYILDFKDIGHKDIAKVGGKGANLGMLTAFGFNVPPGFCITTEAFLQFMKAAPTDFYKQLDKAKADDLGQLRQIGQDLRQKLQALPLPADVETGILAAWQGLGDDEAYAIRSSATAEDLPNASFAGQQDTYLNVRGQEDFLTKVKACLISLFTDRAILYRIQNAFSHKQVALSVVVQRMIQPEVAGILFTADPITGNRHIISIDASFGLGEALVSGLVSADLYQVDKRNNQIMKRQIAQKEMAIESLPGGGTQQIKLEGDARNTAALPALQIIALARIGHEIETQYGKPQDIEWALAQGVYYITQSRPITSLYPLPAPKPKDDSLHIYFSMSHLQVMTNPMPPLALSVLRCILPLGHDKGRLENKYIKTAAGRFYADLSLLLRHPLGRRLLLKALPNMDALAAGAIANFSAQPGFRSKGEKYNPLRMLPTVYPALFKIPYMLFFGKPEGMADKVSAIMELHISDVRQRLDMEQDVEKKFNLAIEEMRTVITPISTWAPYLLSGVIATGGLSALFKNKEDADNLAAMGRGLTGNVVTEMNLEVGDLADLLRRSPALLAHLGDKSIEANARIEAAATIEGSTAFLQAWQDFMQKYGSRATSEIDISQKRWAEDPASLLQMVMNAAQHNKQAAHRVHYQKLIDEGEKASLSLLISARKGWLGWLRAPLAKRLIKVSRNLSPLREHHKFLVMQLFAQLRPVFEQTGIHLAKKGKLNKAQDIWFLALPEIITLLKKPDEALKKVAEDRKDQLAHYAKLSPPHVITSDGEIPALKLDIDAPAGALVGSPVSAGVMEGMARIVLDPATASLKPGEILVAPFTDPGWTPLFVNAAGLVTEVGGLMTHGSVVAREYGIPAVVGVPGATEKIKTGQKLRVHGDVGYIEILEDKA